MSGLVIDGATVRYGATTALDGFDLEVERGEIMAVLGPSGSGKSTLLRAVAGLEPLAAGQILLAGRDLSGVPTHQRELGLMFQDHGLFAHLDVAGNIGYGLRIGGADRAARQTRVSELLTLVGLEGFEARAADQVSGGEAQRVALARALAPEPGLLMLDEPLGSLDRALRDQLTADLRRMLTGIGQTALHVTHDQAEAFAVADRVAVVDAGRPVAVGAPAELWADPGTVFVARFLGHPNIWTLSVDGDGTVRRGDVVLGRVDEDHPVRAAGESQTAVVPATAIRPVADGSHQNRNEAVIRIGVTSSVFRQGLYDVEGTTDGMAGGQPPAFSFMTPQPATVDSVLSIVVDCEAIRPLVDDQRFAGPPDCV